MAANWSVVVLRKILLWVKIHLETTFQAVDFDDFGNFHDLKLFFAVLLMFASLAILLFLMIFEFWWFSWYWQFWHFLPLLSLQFLSVLSTMFFCNNLDRYDIYFTTGPITSISYSETRQKTDAYQLWYDFLLPQTFGWSKSWLFSKSVPTILWVQILKVPTVHNLIA